MLRDVVPDRCRDLFPPTSGEVRWTALAGSAANSFHLPFGSFRLALALADLGPLNFPDGKALPDHEHVHSGREDWPDTQVTIAMAPIEASRTVRTGWRCTGDDRPRGQARGGAAEGTAPSLHVGGCECLGAAGRAACLPLPASTAANVRDRRQLLSDQERGRGAELQRDQRVEIVTS